jgi:hypothetical protein
MVLAGPNRVSEDFLLLYCFNRPFFEVVKGVFLAILLLAGVHEVEAQIGKSSLVSRLTAERHNVAYRSSGRNSESATIRYSSSAQAANMLAPAILLGAPTIVIVALIIMAMKGK